jgi:hypothetical protein
LSLTVRVHAPAEPQDVWARLVDFARWPDWNPTCISAEALGPVAPGTRLRWELRHPRGRTFLTMPQLVTVAPPGRLEWETRALGFRSPTSVACVPGDEGTLVTLTSDALGPLAFTYRLTFPEKTQGLMWSGALTGLARSFARV